MVLDHERLDVYLIALDFLVFDERSHRELATGAEPSRGPTDASLDLDRAESGRGRGQALETRQATILPHGARLLGPRRAPLRSCPTAARPVDVEPSCTTMEHSFHALDSACTMHSNFRPPQNLCTTSPPPRPRSRSPTCPCPCPCPCPISLSGGLKDAGGSPDIAQRYEDGPRHGRAWRCSLSSPPPQRLSLFQSAMRQGVARRFP